MDQTRFDIAPEERTEKKENTTLYNDPTPLCESSFRKLRILKRLSAQIQRKITI